MVKKRTLYTLRLALSNNVNNKGQNKHQKQIRSKERNIEQYMMDGENVSEINVTDF